MIHDLPLMGLTEEIIEEAQRLIIDALPAA
jgi:hypothetical protein